MVSVIRCHAELTTRAFIPAGKTFLEHLVWLLHSRTVAPYPLLKLINITYLEDTMDEINQLFLMFVANPELSASAIAIFIVVLVLLYRRRARWPEYAAVMGLVLGAFYLQITRFLPVMEEISPSTPTILREFYEGTTYLPNQ